VARVDRLILWHLRGGAGAAVFNAIAFILLTSTVISTETGQVSFHPRGLYIIVLLLALGYGVLRHSRVCAVWLLRSMRSVRPSSFVRAHHRLSWQS